MRFTDAFLRQVRDRVSIADFAGRRLAWDKRKSRPAAGDFWACCPFHQEKSASFHVLDGKGIFNCFGCGEKGDVFGLAMKLDGVSFPEAVQRLAELAGVPLPVDEQEDRGENERRKRLQAVVTRAAKFYADALLGSAGASARAYLQGRGIGPNEWKQFGIGLAPGGWTWLIDKLRAEDFSLDEIIAAGLAREGDSGQRPIDTFRERITFEIADPSGRVIAFGARALDKDAKAKYINSPEGPLYSKGRVLYRLKQAREIAAKNKASGLVVVEGYLDVIAFERAGIGAVAPCGTALTEDQLALVWRSGGEPVLCFDGDAAGLRAADRALDLALPHLGPGKTVRLALMPQGEDPDDVFRTQGPQALAPLIAAARSASDALYEREKARRPLSTPEARADFKARLREAASRIADAETKRLYLSDLLRRADEATRPAWTPPNQRSGQPQGYNRGGGARFVPPPPAASAELRARAAAPRPAAENLLRAAIDNPALLSRFGEWIDRLAIADPDLAAIRTGLQMLSAAPSGPETIDREALALHLTQAGEERAAARLSRWPKRRFRPGEAGTEQAGAELETEWLAYVTHAVILPALEEELAAIRPLVDADDPEAVRRAFAIGAEKAKLMAATQSAKIETNFDEPDSAEDLVA